MKKEKLLELVKYIKEKDLIQKYNDVYKEYDEKKEIENHAFGLEDLYTLTDKEIELILASKHDVEALFRFRMNSIDYKDLISCNVKCDDNDVLEVIEKLRIKLDYDEYDKDKRIIKYIVKQEKSGIEKMFLFLSAMAQKRELSETNLKLEDLVFYLMCICETKTYNASNLIAALASSTKKRNHYGITDLSRNSDYSLKVIDKISNCKTVFQVDYISELLKTTVNIPFCNPVLLNNIELMDKRLKVIELFTKAENEDACKKMLETIQENVEILRNNPDRVINMLEECTTLKSDEDYVDITTITKIDELEEILNNIDEGIEIDKSVKVKVEKKK